MERLRIFESGETAKRGVEKVTVEKARGIGDMGIMSEDECERGITTPLLKSIEGRVEDHLIMPDGGSISPKLII